MFLVACLTSKTICPMICWGVPSWLILMYIVGVGACRNSFIWSSVFSGNILNLWGVVFTWASVSLWIFIELVLVCSVVLQCGEKGVCPSQTVSVQSVPSCGVCCVLMQSIHMLLWLWGVW